MSWRTTPKTKNQKTKKTMSEIEKKIREIQQQLSALLPEAKHVREDLQEAIATLSLALLELRTLQANKQHFYALVDDLEPADDVDE